MRDLLRVRNKRDANIHLANKVRGNVSKKEKVIKKCKTGKFLLYLPTGAVCCVRMCACTDDPLQISWRDMNGLEIYK